MGPMKPDDDVGKMYIQTLFVGDPVGRMTLRKYQMAHHPNGVISVDKSFIIFFFQHSCM